jgi:hypothetical protein
MKHKKFNEVYAYTYYLRRKSDGKQYHGVRVGNIKCNRTPVEDMGIHYFSSGKFKREFKANISNFEWKLCFTFDTPDEAIIHEGRVNEVASKLDTWMNAYGKYIPVLTSKISRETTLKEKYGVDHNFKIPQIAQKRKETIKSKYGSENPSQSEFIKEKKSRTFQRRYGVTSPFNLIDVKASLISKYGVDNPQKCPFIREKTYSTNLKKYGVKHTFQSPDVIKQIKERQTQYFKKLALMTDIEFEEYLKTITPTKSSQNQKKSIRLKYRKSMGLL